MSLICRRLYDDSLSKTKWAIMTDNLFSDLPIFQIIIKTFEGTEIDFYRGYLSKEEDVSAFDVRILFSSKDDAALALLYG